MPMENLEDQGLEKNPDLELTHFKFLLTLPEFKNDKSVHAKITEAIKKDGKNNNTQAIFNTKKYIRTNFKLPQLNLRFFV